MGEKKEVLYFNENGDLVLAQDTIGHTKREILDILPYKHCKIIYLNMKNGMDWDAASPVYRIFRHQAAYIMAHFKFKEERK